MASRTVVQFSHLLNLKVAQANETFAADNVAAESTGSNAAPQILPTSLLSIFSLLSSTHHPIPQQLIAAKSSSPASSPGSRSDYYYNSASVSTPGSPSSIQTSPALNFPSLDAVKQSLEQYILLIGNTSAAELPGAADLPATFAEPTARDQSIDDLQWAIIGYATLSVYSHLVDKLCTQTLPLSKDVLYWDSILNSSHNTLSTLLYFLQTAPYRVYSAVSANIKFVPNTIGITASRINPLNFFASNTQGPQRSLVSSLLDSVESVVSTWLTALYEAFGRAQSVAKQLFARTASPFVRTASSTPSSASIWSSLSVFFLLYSPLNPVRNEVALHRKELQQLRNKQAKTLGYLVGESFQLLEKHQQNSHYRRLINQAEEDTISPADHWKLEIQTAANTLAKVLQTDESKRSDEGATLNEQLASQYDQEFDFRLRHGFPVNLLSPVAVATKLVSILDKDLKAHTREYTSKSHTHKKPTWLTRNWPGLALAAYGGVRAATAVIGNWVQIVEWFRTSVVDTLVAFWHNWIVEPLTQIYNTIRHDDRDADMALITKQSLKADVDSLERMVVQFALDHGEIVHSNGSAEEGLEELAARVRQGDISSVLRPYESQIQTPIKSLVSGDLIRSLLIQVQKTKVDVETAVSGIDKLLQSQQLVFGIVAALPSLLVSYWAVLQPASGWLRGASRRSRAASARRDALATVLGRVDRILGSLAALHAAHTAEQEEPDYDAGNRDTAAAATPGGPSSSASSVAGDAASTGGSDDFKTSSQYFMLVGLLLCETYLLRDQGRAILPKARLADWEQDVGDLEDIVKGPKFQQRVVVRIWNVYARYLK